LGHLGFISSLVDFFITKKKKMKPEKLNLAAFSTDQSVAVAAYDSVRGGACMSFNSELHYSTHSHSRGKYGQHARLFFLPI